ncbi:hypothetical protein T07_3128 [Trichinella nelsoni]|uniref:Uncharacterized protein n=1 Tax=Trichinella nelsoni TaxID=6336 RepID=A0A0V0S429_9BILA|nr:hypothetical protein T07_3128 [Trichinella nelsoni]
MVAMLSSLRLAIGPSWSVVPGGMKVSVFQWLPMTSADRFSVEIALSAEGSLPPGRKSLVSLGPVVVHCVLGLIPRWEINGIVYFHHRSRILYIRPSPLGKQLSACSLKRMTSVASRFVDTMPRQPLIT